FSKFKLDNIQGHEVVDMGNGHMWAPMNLDAKLPENPGRYYAWGEIFPKESFTSSNYTYSDSPSILPASADAATQNWGDKWRMPKVEDWDWLVANCTWTSKNNGDSYWYEVVSKVNGNKIILPCAGIDGVAWPPYTCYWTSEGGASVAKAFYWDDAMIGPRDGDETILNQSRYHGMPVRPVI
ncbi:MAG: hypothetical protein II770_02575, partial [Bacteroidales bacterium]|nr:hypothetical protein [Bacteroidales bacterium]